MTPKTKKNAWFVIFDHTADIGVNAFGPTATAVFEQAARGMFDIIFHSSVPKITKKGEYEIKLQGKDLEQLMVDWLGELLFIYTTQHIVIAEYEINIEINKEFCLLDAHVYGETVPEKTLLKSCEIKAVTYHMLTVAETKDGWKTSVLFDI